MSDTGSKGGKKDTDKIQFIKVGSESFSQTLNKKPPPEEREPADINTQVDKPITHLSLDVDDAGLTNEMQLERFVLDEPAVPENINLQDFSKSSQAPPGDELDLLKRYVTLKETEIRDLRDQQKQYQAFIKKISSQLEQYTSQSRNAVGELENFKQREKQLRGELEKLKDRHQGELDLLKSNYEEKLERLGKAQNQASELEHKQSAWQDKVKEDLKRIKLKERELENKYELLRRDTQALLDSKDRHVLELKKKNDALDLEIEGLEDRLRRVTSVLSSVDSKRNKILEMLRLLSGLTEDLSADADAEEKKRAG